MAERWLSVQVTGSNRCIISKATGADNISARMLKGTVSSITPSLTKMFNLSIKTGSFPQSWKCARVVPIPKGGDLSNPTNYRPISILPILSKVLESMFMALFLTTYCYTHPFRINDGALLHGNLLLLLYCP